MTRKRRTTGPSGPRGDRGFEQALKDQAGGRHEAAAAALVAIVTATPGHAAAWRALALSLCALRHTEAELCVRRALQDDPADGELAGTFALLLIEAGRNAEAVEVTAAARARGPGTPHLRFAAASAFYALGRVEEAVAEYRRALGLDGAFVSALNNLGVALLDLRRGVEAYAVLRRGLSLAPEDGRAWNNMGSAHDAAGRLEAAYAAYRRALRLRPDNGRAWNNLGGILVAWKRLDEAIAQRRRAIAADPAYADSYTNLGSAFFEQDRLPAAVALHRRALRLHPRHPAALTALGLALQVQGRTAEAEEEHRRALAIDGRHAPAYSNLGALHLARGDADQAAACLESALSIDPTLPEAHLNRGFLRLGKGDLAGGWLDYGWRFRAKGYVSRPIPAQEWQGEDLSAASVAVWREQGVGDELMFASCYRDLIAHAARTVIECDPRLVTLFARSFPGAAVRAQSLLPDGRERMRPGEVDVHTPAGALPGGFRCRLSGFAESSPWLAADPSRVARWRDRLCGFRPGLVVGIAWRSQFVTTERKGAYTSLDDWGPIFAVPDVRIVNLQYGECAAEVEAAERRFGVPIHRWPDLDLRDDFEETAALVSGVDLVITPATAIGELAGALGVPTWRFGGRDWTQLGTAVRPWFPSMRVWTPRPGEGLPDVLGRIAAALRAMARSRAVTHPPPRSVQVTVPATPAEVAAERIVERAVERYRAGDLDGAEAFCREALGKVAELPAALHLMGVLARRRGDEGAAAGWLRRVLRREPDNAAARAGLAAALRMTGDDPAALAEQRVALALDPDTVDGWLGLGAGLLATDRPSDASLAFGRATALAPDSAAAWTNLGNALARCGRLGEAEACQRRAIARQPGMADAHANLGLLLRSLGRPAEAEAAYRDALAADPGHPQAHYNLGLLLLEHGALRAGWPEHDWRFGTPQFRGQGRRLPMRVWRGENLAGRRILVWREQGVGDEVLFASCLPDLIARAGHVVFECEARLVPLFARSFPAATVRAETADPRDADVHAPLGSLPRYLRPEVRRFPPGAGWLTADPVRSAMWRRRLAALGPGLRVGIAWRSQVMTGDRRAAYLALADLGPVLRIPGLRLVNVQYGDVGDELRATAERFGCVVHRWPDLDLKDDFEGTAALMANLDLVVSPAMSAGELAGALGVPVWRLGGRDWTRLGTAVRPWFPSMRLFQPRPEESLTAVPARIAAALRALMPRPAGEPAERMLERAAALHRDGHLAEAAPLYEAVLDDDPRNPAALHLSGLLAHQRGDSAGGEARIRRALTDAPLPVAYRAPVHVSHALTLLALGRAAAAAGALGRALALDPVSSAALTNLGNVLEAGDRVAAAVIAHGRAVRVEPSLAAAHDNLGVALFRAGDERAAEASHRRAVALDPQLASARLNLGIALRRQGRRDDAHTACRTALAVDPALADAAANLGRLLRELGTAPAAGRWLARALAVQPGLPTARFNQGVLRLARGDLVGGWAGYDARFLARPLIAAARPTARPAWRGEDPAALRVLAWAEQGVGDTLMFGTCLPGLAAAAGSLVVECDPRLVPLFARSLPGVEVRGPSLTEDFDRQVPLGSLPRWLRSDLSCFPATPGWLRPDPARVADLAGRLACCGPGLRVGIHWRSALLSGDRVGEYTGLDAWAPVFAVPGLVLVNLQYDRGEAELEAAERRHGVAVARWADLDLRADLDGVAALMASLDLVIGPATSVGELAASVGTPTWRFGWGGDWTGLGTTVRPWFPAMRTVIARPGESLADVLRRIAADLARHRGAAG